MIRKLLAVLAIAAMLMAFTPRWGINPVLPSVRPTRVATPTVSAYPAP